MNNATLTLAEVVGKLATQKEKISALSYLHFTQGELSSFLLEASRENTNNSELIGWLLEQGADIETRNSQEESPLYVACYLGSYENVKTLVDKEANYQRATQGENALTWCAKSPYEAEKKLALFFQLKLICLYTRDYGQTVYSCLQAARYLPPSTFTKIIEYIVECYGTQKLLGTKKNSPYPYHNFSFTTIEQSQHFIQTVANKFLLEKQVVKKNKNLDSPAAGVFKI